MLNTRLITVFQKFFLLIFILLLVLPLAQFFYTMSLEDTTKIITPANSLFYIEPSSVEMDFDNNTVTDEPIVEIDNSGRDTLDSSVVLGRNDSFNDSCAAQRNLMGFHPVDLNAPSFYQISQDLPELRMGGYYVPNCSHTEKVAIIVPYRDRKDHLGLFLYNIHPMLQRQLIEYQVFVIEQGGNDPFNRAMLFNVGFSEGLKTRNFTCFIFHDVDLIPENDHNLYQCPTPMSPRHMSVAVDTMRYRLPYKALFGGVSALTTEQFKVVNGFSNRYWGWGAEDDDISNRIAFNGLFISRYSPTVARYKMLKHRHQKPNTNRYKILTQGKHRFKTDGLANLNYTVEELATNRLYTQIKVRLARVL